MSIQDRKRGAFYGLAIGDALGAAVEFRPPGTFPEVTGYRDGGPHELAAGQWTDDTSMALALADSIAHGWDKKDQLERYLEWRNNGKYSITGRLFDIGTTTSHSLWEFESTGSLINNKNRLDSGNGSLMRLAPVAIKYYGLPFKDLAEKAAESSETTHASPYCKDCCIYMAVILATLIDGGEDRKILSKEFWPKSSPLDETVMEVLFDEEKEPNGNGFCINSLHAALWAFRTSNSFEEAVLKAVNLGDDADTTGAICGQFAGAYWGYSAIPEHLIEGLDRKDMIDLYLNPIL